MKIAIIIPVYNEEAYIAQMLTTIVAQSKTPNQVIIVDDGSTDNTPNIIKQFTDEHLWISSIRTSTSSGHSPGSKVIQAFYKGFSALNQDFELIGKFDADIMLPDDYFEKTTQMFMSNSKIGLAGGNLYIEKKGSWLYENISEKTKVRGPIKLYRKECFEAIGGLKKSIGWDTVDGLLASYYGWQTKTDITLKVKHLKPTGKVYTKASRYKQGEAFYKMRYGKALTQIAALKLALAKKEIRFYFQCIKGYNLAKKENAPFIVTKEEGAFIRDRRWQGIKKKIV